MTGTITVRPAVPEDLPDYVRIQRLSWDDSAWPMSPEDATRQAERRFAACPEGILIALIDGRPVGTTTQLRMDYNFDHPLTWDQATGGGTCETHNPDGKYWFGVDLSAKGYPHVEAPLFEAAADIVMESGAQGLVWGSRMPGYARYLQYHPGTTPEAYLGRHSNGTPGDALVRMFLEEFPGTRVMGIVREYYTDPASLNNGVLLLWENPNIES